MIPKKSIFTGCTSSQSSDCVVWAGPDMECLGLTTGMSITDVEHIIACKLCDIIDELDLKDLDLSCLVANPTVADADKKLKLILQLLLENQCTLKDLIDAAGGGSDSCCDLTLNLKCLKKLDEFENEIPQDLNQVLQSLVNEVCLQKDEITALQAQANDLQDQIDNLPGPGDPYTLPNITTCVSVSQPLDQATILLATDYCTYKTKVGTPVQIQTAIAQQCPDLNTTLGSTSGWNIAPQNMAQSFANLWIAYCNLLDRVKAIENTCCAPTCDKIKIGFTIEFDSDNATVTLDFTSGAGTLIPSGFVDCGSVLTITDHNGASGTYSSLNITQNGIVGPLSIAGLASGTLIFAFKTKFCLLATDGTVIMTCQDCISKDVEYSSGACCSVTNTGPDPITITYQVTI